MGEDDESIVRRSIDDPLVFEKLVPQHGRALHGYFVRRAAGAADDLHAEVWLVAFTARSKYDPDLGEVRPWLLGIARNVLLAHYRRAHREQPAQIADVLDASLHWADVDERLDARAAGAALRAGLRDLPADEREVLLLVAWERLTPSEAAQVMGIPAGTARSRLHRARQRLRERLTAVDQLVMEGRET